MPIPNPKANEEKKEFISRCMSNETMKSEYPEQKQRSAVCYSTWRDSKGKKEAETIKDGVLKWKLDTDVGKIQEGDRKWCKIGGTALVPGKSRNDVNYVMEHIDENVGKEVSFFVTHDLEPKNAVGKVKFFKEGDKLKYEGKIRNTAEHPDIVEKAEDGLIEVSIDARYDELAREGDEEDYSYEIDGLDIRALCGVGVGGIEGNNIAYAISESFKDKDELREKVDNKKNVSREEERNIEDKEVNQMSDDKVVKENEELKKRIKELEKSKKEIKVDRVMEVNPDKDKKSLMEKEDSELDLILEYEKKLAESDSDEEEETEEKEDEEEAVEEKEKPEGKAIIEDNSEKKVNEKDTDKVIIEKDSGHVTASKELYDEFRKDVRNSVYR